MSEPERIELNNIDHFKLLHEEVHRQHTLMGVRLTWYVTSQAFLVSAYSIALDKSHERWFCGLCLPLLGIAVSVACARTVYATIGAIDTLRAHRVSRFGEQSMRDYFGDRFSEYHLPSMAAQRSLPWVFGLTWLVLLAAFWNWSITYGSVSKASKVNTTTIDNEQGFQKRFPEMHSNLDLMKDALDQYQKSMQIPAKKD